VRIPAAAVVADINIRYYKFEKNKRTHLGWPRDSAASCGDDTRTVNILYNYIYIYKTIIIKKARTSSGGSCDRIGVNKYIKRKEKKMHRLCP
jgi:hypothetical protein